MGAGRQGYFRVKRGAGYTVIKDFFDGNDRIHLVSGRNGLRLKGRGDDALIYLRNDLVAIVEDADSDMLQVKGKFLV